MQTAEQILAVTNESLKRSEQDFNSTRSELNTTNRQLKDAQRQLESIQIQLSKSNFLMFAFRSRASYNDSYFSPVESQRDEARKEGLQRGSVLEEVQNERSELRNTVVSLQTSIKRLESEREDVVKCLEEARKRIAGKKKSIAQLFFDMRDCN